MCVTAASHLVGATASLPQELANAAWQAHAYIPYGNPAPGPGHVRNQIWLYGEPQTLDEFCNLAQIANYVQYRSSSS